MADTAKDLVKRYGVTVTVTGKGTARSEAGWDHNVFEVSINGAVMPVMYRAGMALSGPFEDDALMAYVRDAQAADWTYPQWCAEYGMDNTDENMEAWRACGAIRALLLEKLGADVLAAFEEVEW